MTKNYRHYLTACKVVTMPLALFLVMVLAWKAYGQPNMPQQNRPGQLAPNQPGRINNQVQPPGPGPISPAGSRGSASRTVTKDALEYMIISTVMSPPHLQERQYRQNPELRHYLDRTYPGGMVNFGGHGETAARMPAPMDPGQVWPEVRTPRPVFADELTANRLKIMDEITGYSNPTVGMFPLTPAFAALANTVAATLIVDTEQSVQASQARAKEEQNMANQTAADNNANMERNQAGSALDFIHTYLENFTVDANNRWNRVRNELFLPMAILLLLPGAILAQVKSIVSQGFPVLGEVTPFDGIFRSIVAIFLIPGTYLVVNYGIDLANSIGYTIRTEYQRIFGTDMFRDAMCHHIRAFPVRANSENKWYVPNQVAVMKQLGPNKTAFAEMEGRSIEVKLYDPCAGLYDAPPDRTNEQVDYMVNAQRNGYNTINAALAMTWNILCAFQMCYLYYLWFVGPVVAAMWVYPMKQMRDAFPSWVDGCLTICFWSLFWHTTILLMACFRGVDETGTVMMTALNFLTTACVKFAFDFASLVKDMGSKAASAAEKGLKGAAGKDGGGGSSHGGGGSRSAGGETGGGGSRTGGGDGGTTTASHSVTGPGAGGRTLSDYSVASYAGSTDNSIDLGSAFNLASSSAEPMRAVAGADIGMPPGAGAEASAAAAEIERQKNLMESSIGAGHVPNAHDLLARHGGAHLAHLAGLGMLGLGAHGLHGAGTRGADGGTVNDIDHDIDHNIDFGDTITGTDDTTYVQDQSAIDPTTVGRWAGPGSDEKAGGVNVGAPPLSGGADDGSGATRSLFAGAGSGAGPDGQHHTVHLPGADGVDGASASSAFLNTQGGASSTSFDNFIARVDAGSGVGTGTGTGTDSTSTGVGSNEFMAKMTDQLGAPGANDTTSYVVDGSGNRLNMASGDAQVNSSFIPGTNETMQRDINLAAAGATGTDGSGTANAGQPGLGERIANSYEGPGGWTDRVASGDAGERAVGDASMQRATFDGAITNNTTGSGGTVDGGTIQGPNTVSYQDNVNYNPTGAGTNADGSPVLGRDANTTLGEAVRNDTFNDIANKFGPPSVNADGSSAVASGGPDNLLRQSLDGPAGATNMAAGPSDLTTRGIDSGNANVVPGSNEVIARTSNQDVPTDNAFNRALGVGYTGSADQSQTLGAKLGESYSNFERNVTSQADGVAQQFRDANAISQTSSGIVSSTGSSDSGGSALTASSGAPLTGDATYARGSQPDSSGGTVFNSATYTPTGSDNSATGSNAGLSPEAQKTFSDMANTLGAPPVDQVNAGTGRSDGAPIELARNNVADSSVTGSNTTWTSGSDLSAQGTAAQAGIPQTGMPVDPVQAQGGPQNLQNAQADAGANNVMARDAQQGDARTLGSMINEGYTGKGGFEDQIGSRGENIASAQVNEASQLGRSGSLSDNVQGVVNSAGPSTGSESTMARESSGGPMAGMPAAGPTATPIDSSSTAYNSGSAFSSAGSGSVFSSDSGGSTNNQPVIPNATDDTMRAMARDLGAPTVDNAPPGMPAGSGASEMSRQSLEGPVTNLGSNNVTTGSDLSASTRTDNAGLAPGAVPGSTQDPGTYTVTGQGTTIPGSQPAQGPIDNAQMNPGQNLARDAQAGDPNAQGLGNMIHQGYMGEGGFEQKIGDRAADQARAANAEATGWVQNRDGSLGNSVEGVVRSAGESGMPNTSANLGRESGDAGTMAPLSSIPAQNAGPTAGPSGDPNINVVPGPVTVDNSASGASASASSSGGGFFGGFTDNSTPGQTQLSRGSAEYNEWTGQMAKQLGAPEVGPANAGGPSVPGGPAGGPAELSPGQSYMRASGDASATFAASGPGTIPDSSSGSVPGSVPGSASAMPTASGIPAADTSYVQSNAGTIQSAGGGTIQSGNPGTVSDAGTSINTGAPASTSNDLSRVSNNDPTLGQKLHESYDKFNDKVTDSSAQIARQNEIATNWDQNRGTSLGNQVEGVVRSGDSGSGTYARDAGTGSIPGSIPGPGPSAPVSPVDGGSMPAPAQGVGPAPGSIQPLSAYTNDGGSAVTGSAGSPGTTSFNSGSSSTSGNVFSSPTADAGAGQQATRGAQYDQWTSDMAKQLGAPDVNTGGPSAAPAPGGSTDLSSNYMRSADGGNATNYSSLADASANTRPYMPSADSVSAPAPGVPSADTSSYVQQTNTGSPTPGVPSADTSYVQPSSAGSPTMSSAGFTTGGGDVTGTSSVNNVANAGPTNTVDPATGRIADPSGGNSMLNDKLHQGYQQYERNVTDSSQQINSQFATARDMDMNRSGSLGQQMTGNVQSLGDATGATAQSPQTPQQAPTPGFDQNTYSRVDGAPTPGTPNLASAPAPDSMPVAPSLQTGGMPQQQVATDSTTLSSGGISTGGTSTTNVGQTSAEPGSANSQLARNAHLEEWTDGMANQLGAPNAQHGTGVPGEHSQQSIMPQAGHTGIGAGGEHHQKAPPTDGAAPIFLAGYAGAAAGAAAQAMGQRQDPQLQQMQQQMQQMQQQLEKQQPGQQGRQQQLPQQHQQVAQPRETTTGTPIVYASRMPERLAQKMREAAGVDRDTALEQATGRTSGGGKPANKLASALGRAASRQPKDAGREAANLNVSKRISDPLGSVASGTTLRRGRSVKKLTKAEIAEQERIARESGWWID